MFGKQFALCPNARQTIITTEYLSLLNESLREADVEYSICAKIEKTMTDWSEDTILKFLEAYQNEPCIWNPKHVNHKNRQKVNDAWTRISLIVNKNIKELKNKKETLMATFRRHLKKKQDFIRSGAGANEVYKPIWFAYELMESFLLAVYTALLMINNVSAFQQVPR